MVNLIKKIRNNIDIYDLLMFLSVIFIGSDVWAINIIVNIRLIQLFYLIVVVFLIVTRRYIIYVNKYFVIFLLSASISVLVSVSIFQSLLYYFWILYDFIVLIPIFYIYVKERGPQKFTNIILYSFRIIVVLIFVQFVLDGILHIELSFLRSQHHMGVTRPALWFYEPSYLASFLMIYLGISTYKLIVNKELKSILDVVLAILSLVIITSTTGFLGIVIALGIAFVIYICYAESNKERVFGILIALGSVVIIFLGVRIFLPNVYDLFIARIFNDGLASASGDRIYQYNNQIQAFLQAPMFGVGLDAYGAYMGNINLEATNITLELLSCNGIIGCLCFYIMLFVPIIKAFFTKNKNDYKHSKPLAIALLLLIIILQANQNYMRLYLWMMIIVCYASIECEKKENESKVLEA